MSVFVWAALGRARNTVGEVLANERGEALGRRGEAREFFYPTAQAVLAVAKPALSEARLIFVVLRIGAAISGLVGAELPIVFGLIHWESGDIVEIPVVWPLADVKDFAGRPQAQAATISSAEKHQLLHLLAIDVVATRGPAAPSRATASPTPGEVLDALVGEMPDWDSLAAAPPSAPPPGPPAHLDAAWRAWQSREFRPRAHDAEQSVLLWPDFVGRVLGGEPRECRTQEEQDRVAACLVELHAAPVDAAWWRALNRRAS